MIVANFFHIKASNGLFFYGLDYVRENFAHVRKALVRPALEAEARRALPDCNIVVCGTGGFLREALQARRRGDLLFTPTSHPLPGITHQWIVVHDAYPFIGGGRNALKRRLLALSLALSRCRVAFINRSDAQPFIDGLGVPASRQVFAPNRFPPPPTTQPRLRHSEAPLTIGLVGTDSAKKNYAELLAAVTAQGPVPPLVFRIYGHDSLYFRQVREQFPNVPITLVSSDECSLDQFFRDIDVLASVATQEGFGRPIAAALLGGIPCVLVHCRVFREFYQDAAVFSADAHALVQVLLDAVRAPLPRPRYMPTHDAVEGWRSANALLAQLGCTAGQ